jgi:hypothetical protein
MAAALAVDARRPAAPPPTLAVDARRAAPTLAVDARRAAPTLAVDARRAAPSPLTGSGAASSAEDDVDILPFLFPPFAAFFGASAVSSAGAAAAGSSEAAQTKARRGR